jgi:hypothetical protein
LFNTFDNWCLEGMSVVVIDPLPSFSLMKWQSVSMCFILSCWIGLRARPMSDLLSQNNSLEPLQCIFKSSSTSFIHHSLQVLCFIALGSATALDQSHDTASEQNRIWRHMNDCTKVIKILLIFHGKSIEEKKEKTVGMQIFKFYSNKIINWLNKSYKKRICIFTGRW